jgi:alkanesulfonate monooxygenase SsuD/methylene tetrahydromethanopterin reductase-like flavin-dependent oxidoreductase (luciferase family)
MERDFITSWNANVIHGTPDEVRTGLDDLQKRTGADELMITANAHSGEIRLRSYELIADAYALPTAP